MCATSYKDWFSAINLSLKCEFNNNEKHEH